MKFENDGQFRRFEKATILSGAVYLAGLLRRPINYTELGYILDTFPGSGEMNRALSDQVESDVKYELPLFSSLVVSNQTMMPGPGFFTAAYACDFRFTDKARFAREQQIKCFKLYE